MKDLSRAVGYCRVSTQRQSAEGHGLERYIAQLQTYGLTENQIYWDIESGNSEKRIGYNKILDLVRSQQVDKIIVPCFDRFTRSALGWELARQELQDFGVELILLDSGNLDINSPDGLLFGRVLAAFSAQVRDKNKYNSLQGHRFFQEKRKIYQAIFGLKKDGDTVKPNQDIYKSSQKTFAAIGIEIIDLFLETGNMTFVMNVMAERYGFDRDEVKYLDFPRTPSSLKRWLENPLLCGKIRYYAEEKDKTVVINSDHQGIISEDKFNEIALLLSKNAGGRKTFQKNPLVSLTFCGLCGGRMKKVTNTVKKKKTGKIYVNEYLHCTHAKPVGGKPQTCSYRKFFKVPEAIAATIDALKSRANDLASSLENTVTDIEIPPEILLLQQEILRLKNLGDNDYDSVILRKQQKLESLLGSTETNAITKSYHHELYRRGIASDNFWNKTTSADLTFLFQELVEKVVCCVSSDGVQSFSVSLKS